MLYSQFRQAGRRQNASVSQAKTGRLRMDAELRAGGSGIGDARPVPVEQPREQTLRAAPALLPGARQRRAPQLPAAPRPAQRQPAASRPRVELHQPAAQQARAEHRNIAVRGYNCSDSTGDCSAGADAISILGGAHHIWLDHMAIYDGSDGNLDITQASDFITVSWT
jgi:hypothetical protein